MVVSSTSMKVGTMTANATIQGLIAGRLTTGAESATLLMTDAPFPRLRFGLVCDTNPKRKRGARLGSVFGICGELRQQGEGLTSPHGETGNASFEFPPAAIHVYLKADAVADAQVSQLGFLEVGVD